MAKHLKKANKKGTISSWLLIGILSMVSACCFAESYADPTRPPAAFSNPVSASDTPPPVVGPTLQSILVAPTRVIAIINGQPVKVGDTVGEATVVKISDSEVVLRTGKELKVLKLFPNVEKQMSPQRGGFRVESRRP